MNYWELHLRASASGLPSLQYFKPEFMSLARPHPIFTSAGSSPYSVAMAKVQSIMLSGRYRTEALSSHWSETRSAHCKTPHCKDLGIREDLLHILATCKSLEPTRERLKDFTRKYCSRLDSSEVQRIIHTYSSPTHPQFCQFLTDCSVLPDVIVATQAHGQEGVHRHLFNVTRTWCYCLHRDRLRILDHWIPRWCSRVYTSTSSPECSDRCSPQPKTATIPW